MNLSAFLFFPIQQAFSKVISKNLNLVRQSIQQKNHVPD
jgi:hypothetical protein